MRDREGHREKERARERERGGGVITLATLTRRRPDSRSRSTRSTRSTRLRLTYTPTLGLPLHLLPSPPSLTPFPLPPARRSSLPRRAPLRPPAFLPFLRLPFLLAIPVSSSASSTLCAVRFIRVHSSIAEPESTDTRARERPERCSLRESLLRRRQISDAMQLHDLAVGPSMNPLSPPCTSTTKFTVCARLCTCLRRSFPSVSNLEYRVSLPRTDGAVSRGTGDRRMNC